MTDGYGSTVVMVATGIIGLAVMAVLAGTVVGTAFDVAEPETVNSSLDIESGQARLPQPSQNREYQQSLGTALQFDGDGGLTSGEGVSIDETAELCTHARIRDTTTNQTIATTDGELTLRFAGNGSSEWVATWYNRSSTNLYGVRATAADPSNLTAVCARTDGQNLTLATNATDRATQSIDGTGTDPSLAYGALNGTVEETRVFDRTLNASERAILATQPTHPLENPAAARIMYDTRADAPGSIPVYWADTQATVENGTAVAGVAGQSLSEGGDYRIDRGDIVALDGGSLDAAPVVFITYEERGGPMTAVLSSLSGIGSTALTILVIALLVIGAGRVREAMDGF
jgi:hypothetical protein